MCANSCAGSTQSPCTLIPILLSIHLVLLQSNAKQIKRVCVCVCVSASICVCVCVTVRPLITSVVKQAAADVAAINIKIKQLHEQIS